MKNKLTHLLYVGVISVILLTLSATNVLQEEMRLELTCKSFILDAYKDRSTS
jgi:hypothetical protein